MPLPKRFYTTKTYKRHASKRYSITSSAPC